MFDLERAIVNWRQNMSSGGINSPEVIEELEAHLREDIEQKMAAGADAEAAFEAATKAIGAPELLRTEFVKLEPPRHLHTWFRVLFYVLPVAILLISVWTLLAYDVSRWQLKVGILALSAICLCLIGFPKLCDVLAPVGHKRLAKVIKLTSILLCFWPVLALLEALNVVHLHVGIVASVVIWNFYAAYGLIGCWGALNARFGGGGSSGFGPTGELIPSGPPRSPSDPIVQETLHVAGEEAQRLGHDFIGTEHVLLGLLRLAKGPFVNVLRKLSVDPTAVRTEIERLVAPVEMSVPPAARRLTPRAGKAVEIAAREARTLKHPRITPEHLFLGLLLEGSGVAAIVLRKLGVGVKRARHEILSELRAQPLG